MDWFDTGRAGFQPRTQSANPKLPDGSVPVSGVVPPSPTVIVVETTDACGRPVVVVRRPLVAGLGVHHMADPEDG